MAKTKKASAGSPTFGIREAKRHYIWAAVFLVIGFLFAVALWDYDWTQNKEFVDPVLSQNKIGSLGLFLASNSLLALGRAAWLFPAWLLWMGGMLLARQSGKLIMGRYIAWFGLLVSVPILFDLWQTYQNSSVPGFSQAFTDSGLSNYYKCGYGGWIGRFLYQGFLHTYVGSLGSLLIFGVVTGLCAVYVFFDNLGAVLRRLMGLARRFFGKLFGGFGGWFSGYSSRRAERAQQRQALAQERAEAKAVMRQQIEARAAEKKVEIMAEEKARAEVAKTLRAEARAAAAASPAPELPPQLPPEEHKAASSLPPPKKRSLKLHKSVAEDAAEMQDSEPVAPAVPEPVPAEEPKPAAKTASGLKIVETEQTRKVVAPQPQKKGDYEFPTLELLAEPPPPPPSDDETTHQQVADQLVRTLAEFGVKVTMGEVHPGPVITRYDLYPAAGVRVEKIQNLDKNLALALRAMSVRILAPVPGKGCVGVEIPNRQPQSVFIRDILESENWVNCKAEIPIALGKEVSGKPLVADLTKMPHMLIAGATGSGKTVCINSIIASLLYKMSPADVRFVMVDPKIVEMQVYNSLPHMLIPVVTDPRKVPGALKYLINEMERRYRMFAKEGVRNIAGFNAKITKDKEAEEKAKEFEATMSPEERAAQVQAATLEVPRELDFEETTNEKLPYILCVIDELADLMMVAPADVETGIARLAQLARAAGIHLVIATQRPSVNVITGIIKANLPSRIAFKVASKVDSRTILDSGGADQLIGRGDMLFLPPGIAELVRSQGAFVADEEINAVVKFVNEHNGEPEFDEQFQRSVEESADGGDDDGDSGGEEEGDALIPDALEVIRTSNRASTSMLQRRLRIGYNRAARIMDILEDRGYVGPENGSMPREILRDLNED